MGRPKRITLGGYFYHVLNRANGRLRIFKKDSDFAAFEQILCEGVERFAMRICGYCLMGNHWHLLLWPRYDGDLSAFMRWITLTHVQRFHAAHDTVGIGHLYQGRYKSFPVQGSQHYLTVLRYIEANPVRAEIVQDAADWPWSSYAVRRGRAADFNLTQSPVALPPDWTRRVHRSIEPRAMEALRNSINRNRPLGDTEWIIETAKKMGLESTLRKRGRPKKVPDPFS
jgi:putative transposase